MCKDVRMVWVVDSSSWISLARSGLLSLVERLPLDMALLDLVHDEVVGEGVRTGHADAELLEAVLGSWTRVPAPGGRDTVDAAVLAAAQQAGGLVCNDLALGRRARSLAIPWLRTADLMVLAVRTAVINAGEGAEAIDALEAAGRISQELAGSYRGELR